MTLTDLLQKLKSNDKRDALAEDEREATIQIAAEKAGFNSDGTTYAFHEGAKWANEARTKDVELLVALVERALAQRNYWWTAFEGSFDDLCKDNKELEQLALNYLKQTERGE